MTFASLHFVFKAHDLYFTNPIFCGHFFSHGTNKKRRIATQSNTKEESGKNKAEKAKYGTKCFSTR